MFILYVTRNPEQMGLCYGKDVTNGRVEHTRTRHSQYREAKFPCGDKNLNSGYQQSGTNSDQRKKNLPALAVMSLS